MKYLFVIYTDKKYKKHLDHFKSQEFYKEICEDKNIEVIEWGAGYHTDYTELPTKTQKMMKWCSENKEYDYLIKCDDTIFDDKWEHYRSMLSYENIFKNNDLEHSWKWGAEFDSYKESYSEEKLQELWDNQIFIKPNKHWESGYFGSWVKVNKLNKDYRGINLLRLKYQDWINYKNSHSDIKDFDISKLKEISFFEGKYYVVSKELSIFIGKQESFAKEMVEKLPVEDLMVGYLVKSFK